jgi:hypothetical protein
VESVLRLVDDPGYAAARFLKRIFLESIPVNDRGSIPGPGYNDRADDDDPEIPTPLKKPDTP